MKLKKISVNDGTHNPPSISNLLREKITGILKQIFAAIIFNVTDNNWEYRRPQAERDVIFNEGRLRPRRYRRRIGDARSPRAIKNIQIRLGIAQPNNHQLVVAPRKFAFHRNYSSTP